MTLQAGGVGVLDTHHEPVALYPPSKGATTMDAFDGHRFLDYKFACYPSSLSPTEQRQAEDRTTDDELIALIAERVVALPWSATQRPDPLDVIADLVTAHHDCPFNLAGLLAASVTDFCHDVFGIRRFLNRRTGELNTDGGFTPRYAR